MSLKSDLDEIIDLWNNGSLITKSIAVLILVITTSSIVSLADIIFKWKGFILDGIEIYRIITSAIFSQINDIFGFSYIQVNRDTIVIFTLLAASWARFIWSDAKNESRNEILFNVFLTLSCVLFPVAYLFYFYNNLDHPGMSFMGYAIAIGGIIVWPFLTKFDARMKTILWGPLLLAIGITLILGAINAGLSKSPI